MRYFVLNSAGQKVASCRTLEIARMRVTIEPGGSISPDLDGLAAETLARAIEKSSTTN